MSFRDARRIYMHMKLTLIGYTAAGSLILAIYMLKKRARPGSPMHDRAILSYLYRCFIRGIFRFFRQLLTILKTLVETVLNRSRIRIPSIWSLYFSTFDAFLPTWDATVLADFIPFFAPLSDRLRNFLNLFFKFFGLSFFLADLFFLSI